MQKYGLFSNTHQLPLLKKLVLFFDVKKIKDLNSLRALNYFYFIRFFFGKRAGFFNISSTFHLGVTFFSYRIFTCFFSAAAFFPLMVFINDFLGFSWDKSFSFRSDSRGERFSISFTDMNIFTEKKNTLGFYFLKDSLNLSIFFKSTDYFSSFFLIHTFKLFYE